MGHRGSLTTGQTDDMVSALEQGSEQRFKCSGSLFFMARKRNMEVPVPELTGSLRSFLLGQTAAAPAAGVTATRQLPAQLNIIMKLQTIKEVETWIHVQRKENQENSLLVQFVLLSGGRYLIYRSRGRQFKSEAPVRGILQCLSDTTVFCLQKPSPGPRTTGWYWRAVDVAQLWIIMICYLIIISRVIHVHCRKRNSIIAR